MKKYLLLVTTIFQATLLFGQTKGSSTGNLKLSPEFKHYSSCNESMKEVQRSLSYFTEWRNVSCYSKIQYRIAVFSLGIKRGSRVNSWQVHFKNNHSKYAIVTHKVYVGNELMIHDSLEIEPNSYWGVDCAGASGATYSKSLALDYRLEIEQIKLYEKSDWSNKRNVEISKCDGSLSVPAYKSFYPADNSSTDNSTKQEGITQLANATVDLINYFKNRKNALRNALSKEDGQALLNIANAESPTDYVQNIIQILRT